MSATYGDALAQLTALRVHAPVAALVDVDAIPAGDRVNGMLVGVVADQTTWMFILASSASSSSTVRVPTDGLGGRWLNVTGAALAALLVTLGHIAKSTWTTVKTANYTAAVHEFVKYDPTGGTFAIFLPSAVGLGADDGITLINDSTSTTAVTVNVTGGVQTIKGNGGVAATTYTLNLAGQTTVFIPDGVGWYAAPGT